LLAVQNIAQKAFDSLGGPLRSLVSIAFGLYIAYITLIAVATPATQKISQYLTNLSTQGFKVAIALVLLANPATIYNLAIGPLIDGGVEFGITLTGEDKAKIQDFGKSYTFANETDTYLQAEVLQNTVGAAAAFNDAAVRIPAIGRSMMCNAFVDKHFEIFPHFKMLVIGIIFYIFGLLIAFAIGFYMLDCALQLGIVCAMIPFFIACWPFKLTKSYTKQGWDIFLNTFFNFVIMGVVITASSEIMQQAISTGLSAETLETYLNSNNIEALVHELDFGGMQMVMLVICCLIAFKLAGEVQNITNKLSGGLGISAGAQIGGTISSTVNKAAAGAAAATWSGAKGAAGTMAESSGLAGGARALKGAIGNGFKSVGGALGAGSKAKAGGIADTAGKGLNQIGNAAGKVGLGKIASAAHTAGNALESVGKGRDQGGDGGE
jgi:type IV secretory pathway VirB6-like protein